MKPRLTNRRGARLAIAAGMCACVATLTVLSGCSAGNVTQTAAQAPGIAGANLNAGPDGYLALRDLVVVYNGPAGYPGGSSAPLVVRIFNSGLKPVKLVKVSAGGAAKVVLVNGAQVVIESPQPSGSANPSESATAGPTPTEQGTPSAPTGRESFSIDISPDSYALLVPGKGAYLRLDGLTAPFKPGMLMPVTFTFDDGTTATAQVPLGPPEAPASRVTGNTGHGE